MIAKLVNKQLLCIDFLVPVIPVHVKHATVLHRILEPDTTILDALSLSGPLEVGVAPDTREYYLVERSLNLLLPRHPILIRLLLRNDFKHLVFHSWVSALSGVFRKVMKYYN